MTRSSTLLRRAIAAAALCAAALLPLPAAAVTYFVSVDTSGIAGQAGLVDLQFNPGGADAPSATAIVSSFTGPTLVGGPTIDGEVAGALPGPQVFGNGTGFNASLQEVTFGATLSFLLSLSGDFETAASGDGTAFALGILDAGLAPLLGADPASGASLVFDLLPGAGPTFVAYDDAISVTAIPEPGTYALLLAGVLMLVAAGRRSVRRDR